MSDQPEASESAGKGPNKCVLLVIHDAIHKPHVCSSGLAAYVMMGAFATHTRQSPVPAAKVSRPKRKCRVYERTILKKKKKLLTALSGVPYPHTSANEDEF